MMMRVTCCLSPGLRNQSSQHQGCWWRGRMPISHPVSPNITILVLSECLTSAWLATTMLIDQTEGCGRTLLLVSWKLLPDLSSLRMTDLCKIVLIRPSWSLCREGPAVINCLYRDTDTPLGGRGPGSKVGLLRICHTFLCINNSKLREHSLLKDVF